MKLPEGQADQALGRLAEAQARDQLLDKKLTVIDLRQAERIIVQTAPGQVEDYKKGSEI